MHADLKPNLYRVAVTALIVALAGNVLLWRVARGDDTFATVIGIASGAAAVVLAATAFVHALERWREAALLAAVAVWTANVIEWAAQGGVTWESRVRSCAFYGAFAVLALGTFIAVHLVRTGRP